MTLDELRDAVAMERYTMRPTVSLFLGTNEDSPEEIRAGAHHIATALRDDPRDCARRRAAIGNLP